MIKRPKAIVVLPKQEVRTGETILIPPAYVEISGEKPDLYRAVVTEDMIVKLPSINQRSIKKRVIFTIYSEEKIHIKIE